MPPTNNKPYSFADAAAQQPQRQRFSFADATSQSFPEQLPGLQSRLPKGQKPTLTFKQTPTQQRNLIAKDKERGVSISQGGPIKESYYRKAIRAIPGDSRFERSLERDVLDPIAKVASFFLPSEQDAYRRATEEDPSRTTEQIIARGREMITEEGFTPPTEIGGAMFSPLDSVTAGVGSISRKGGSFLKSLLGRVTKETNPKVISKALEDAAPLFKRMNTTGLSEQLAKTNDPQAAQRLIDGFIQKNAPTPAPKTGGAFSFAKKAQTKTAQKDAIANSRDVVIKRLEEPVPISKKADIIQENNPKLKSDKDDYLEFIKNTKEVTQDDINRGIEMLRLEGKQIKDLLTQEVPVNKKLDAFNAGKPSLEGGFAKVPGAQGKSNIPKPIRESLSSTDNSTPPVNKKQHFDIEDSGDIKRVEFLPKKLGGFDVDVSLVKPDGTISFIDRTSIEKATEKYGTSDPEELARQMVGGVFDPKKEVFIPSPGTKVVGGSNTPTPKAPTPEKATKQASTKSTAEATIKQQKATAVPDAKATKEWEAEPVKAQAEATQKVAKEYSGTDSSKGFISDAHNHVDGLPPVTNVTAKARNFSSKNEVPIDLPDQTLGQYVLTQTQDMAHRLGYLQKTLTKRGIDIGDDANAYVQREAYVGRAAARIGKMEKDLGMQAGNKTGIFPKMKKDGIDIEDLNEYMQALATKDRNARIATVSDGKIKDGGAGRTNKEAEVILKKWENNQKIKEYAKQYREEVINPTIKIQVDAGLLTKEQAEMITKYEPNYVPFKIADETTRPLVGKGFSVKGRSIKGLKGSLRKDRTNSVMQAASDMQTVIMRSEKNKSLQSLAELIRQNPDKNFWEIKGVRHIPQYDETGELMFMKPSRVGDNKNNVVEFWENGKPHEIIFHDEALAKVFTEEGMVKPVKVLTHVNNYLRAVNTVVNPEFMVSNAIRDLQTAIVTAGGEKGLVVAGKMVKDQPKAMKGIWQATRKDSNEGWAKVYNEMVEAGGRTGWFDLNEVADETKRVSKMINRYNSDKTSDSLMKAYDSTAKLISDANEVAEMSIRVSAYKQLTDGGMSKMMAANYAKNMTVNFNKRGNLGLMMNSLYLFANAGIQGSARIAMAMKYPKVRRIVYGITASAYGINELNNQINPEGYNRVQDFEKERNLIVMLPLDGNKYDLPGISGDPRNGYYLKVPLPYGFNVFKVAGDTAYDLVNKKKTPTEAMWKTLSSIDAAFNPLSSGTPIQFISPSVTDPFISSKENKNWFGAPIMPEQPAFAPEVRDSDRYFSGARDLSVGTAQFLNRLTGGNEVTAGAVDISPETIDHIIDTFGGGLGNFIGTSVDGAVNTVQGDIPTPDEMPFVRKLIDTPFETGEQSQAFEMLQRSATNRMSQIEINRFVDNVIGALEMGQIEMDTFDRITGQFVENAVNQEAGEVMSLINENKTEEAMEVLRNAPPGITKQLNKLLDKEIDKMIEELKK